MDKKTNIHFRLSFQLNKEGIDEANTRLVELFKTLNQANDASKSATKQWQEYAMGAAGITTALSGLNDAISNLTSSYLSFDSAMRRVNTMAGLGQESFEQITEAVNDLAQSIHLAREQLADGLYQVISNGVPTDNWIDFLNASGRASTGPRCRNRRNRLTNRASPTGLTSPTPRRKTVFSTEPPLTTRGCTDATPSCSALTRPCSTLPAPRGRRPCSTRPSRRSRCPAPCATLCAGATMYSRVSRLSTRSTRRSRRWSTGRAR